MIEIDEETQKEKFTEEFAFPGIDELKSLETWGHAHTLILKAGRVSHVAPPQMSEEEREEYLAKVSEKDSTVDRFRGINDDTPIEGMETSWISKTAGDA